MDVCSKTWQCKGLRASHCQPRREQPKKPDRLERENERLSRENDKLHEKLIERDRKLVEFEKQIAKAEKQIADLERKLALRQQNSTTSSEPPSSDGTAGAQRSRGSRRKKSHRTPGGQHGHDGRWRGLAPLSRVDELKKVFRSSCRHCDHPFVIVFRVPAPGLFGKYPVGWSVVVLTGAIRV